MRSTGAAAASVLVTLAATGCAAPETTTEAPPPQGAGIVALVNDGDTLRLTDGRKVRLLQIDAPELQTDCYGRAALALLRRLAPEGARVTLQRDPDLDDRDRYGRLLRYVFAGGRNVNLALVRAGAASPYFYRKERGRYAEDLLDAVDEARAGMLGYWGACPRARLDTAVGSITGPG